MFQKCFCGENKETKKKLNSNMEFSFFVMQKKSLPDSNKKCYSLMRSSQQATAAAAATLSESTPCFIGMRTT